MTTGRITWDYLSRLRVAYLVVITLLLSSLFAITDTPSTNATGNITISGTIGYFDSATSTVKPFAQKRLTIGSSQLSLTNNFFTDANGQYSTVIPSGATDYTMNMDWTNSNTLPLPSYVAVYLSDMTFTQDTTFNVTFPGYKEVQVVIKDQNGNPLPGATAEDNTGYYGGASQATVTGYAGPFQINTFMGSGNGGYVSRYVANSSGVAKIYLPDRNALSSGQVTYRSPAGFEVISTFSVNPMVDSLVNVTLNIPQNVTISGVLSYVDSASATMPMQKAEITFRSNTLNTSITTNALANGSYSVTVPAAGDYAAFVEWASSAKRRQEITVPSDYLNSETPAYNSVSVSGLVFDGNKTLNITLPRARKIAFTARDQNGNPLQGVRFGTSFGGGESTATISGYTGTPSAITVGSNGRYNDITKYVYSDASGVANLWTFTSPYINPADYYYAAPAGFVKVGSVDYASASDQNVSVTLNLPPTVQIQGKIAYTNQENVAVPIANKVVSVQSSVLSVSETATSDANGDFVLTVPQANDYSFNLEYLPGVNDPLPPWLSFSMNNLEFQTNTTLNIQLPKPKKLTTRMIDAVGNPLPGSTYAVPNYSGFGTFETATVVGSVGTPTQNLGFGGGWGGYQGKSYADQDGYASIYAFTSPSLIETQLTYRASTGYTISATKPLTVTGDVNFVQQYDRIVRATSQGQNSGAMDIFIPTGITISDVDIRPSTANDIPDGAIDLTGVLSYTLRGLSPGQTVAITFALPVGTALTNVFKNIAGDLVDMASIATISGQQVTMLITDGGVGDDDALVNGRIVDPVTFINTTSSNSVATLSTFTINETNAITPGTVINVASGTTSVAVVATPSAIGATRIISGNTSLQPGNNTVTVRVTAANSTTTTTYSATVVVAAAASSSVSGGSTGGGGGGGGGAPKQTALYFQVVDPSDATKIYAKSVCVEIYSRTLFPQFMGTGCSGADGRINVLVGDAKVSIRVFELGNGAVYKEYLGEVASDTFTLDGGKFFAGTTRYAISLPGSKSESVTPAPTPTPAPVVTPTPTTSVTPTPVATPTPTPSATEIPTPTPTVTPTPTPSAAKGTYFAITTSNANLAKVAIKNSSTSVSSKVGRSVQFTVASIGTKSAIVKLSLKDPAGKSFVISSSSIAKNKSYSSPKIKFAKAGSYLATLTIGASKKIIKINVTK